MVSDTVTKALDSVSAVLTTEALQALNAQVEVDRKDPAEVATQFLADNGLSARVALPRLPRGPVGAR